MERIITIISNIILIIIGTICMCAGTDLAVYVLTWWWSDPVLTTLTQMKMHFLGMVAWLLISAGVGSFWQLWESFTQCN